MSYKYVGWLRTVELFLLSGLIANPHEYSNVIAILSTSDFKYSDSQVIFDIVLSANRESLSDPITIFSKLTSLGIDSFIIGLLVVGMDMYVVDNIIADALLLKKQSLARQRKTATAEKNKLIDLALKQLEPGHNIPVFDVVITRTTRSGQKQWLSANKIATALLSVTPKYLKYDYKKRTWLYYQYGHWLLITRKSVLEKVNQIIIANCEGCHIGIHKISNIIDALEGHQDFTDYKKLARKKWKKFERIDGDGNGRYAVIACNNTVITLYKIKSSAKLFQYSINDAGCNEHCHSYKHLLFDLRT